MKCNNCGAANGAGQLRCTNCNAPLLGSMMADPNHAGFEAGMAENTCGNCGTSNNSNALRCKQCNAPLQGSILGKPSSHSGAAASPESEKERATAHSDHTNPCPQCAYPNIPEAKLCVACGSKIAQDAAGSHTLPFSPNPRHQNMPDNKTVNPWQQIPPSGFCLQPITSGQEPPLNPKVFKGDSVALNREILDAGNRTITSQVQAIIEFRDGQWWLMDRSAQCTTFLLVPHTGVPLKAGDKILMGNRVFEFKPDPE
jgi:hypothetical protein